MKPRQASGDCISWMAPTSSSERICAAFDAWCDCRSPRLRAGRGGAYDAISREMISITNSALVNTETICDLVQLIERTNRRRNRIPITLVLDNAWYQRNSWVKPGGGRIRRRPAVSAKLFAESESASKKRCGNFGTRRKTKSSR